MSKRLTKSATDKKWCGVLGGLAEYMDMDPTLVRIGYSALTLFCAGFPGFILYFVMAFVMPYGNGNTTQDNDGYQK